MKNYLADALYHALWAERAMIGLKAALVRFGGDEVEIKNATAGLEHLYDCQRAIKQAMIPRESQ